MERACPAVHIAVCLFFIEMSVPRLMWLLLCLFSNEIISKAHMTIHSILEKRVFWADVRW